MVHIVQKPATALVALWNFGRGLLWMLRTHWKDILPLPPCCGSLRPRLGGRAWPYGGQGGEISQQLSQHFVGQWAETTHSQSLEAKTVPHGVEPGVFSPHFINEAQVMLWLKSLAEPKSEFCSSRSYRKKGSIERWLGVQTRARPPDSATSLLCDLGQVNLPLCAPVSQL